MSMPRPRSCGILLHPTSLPGSGGIGTLGKPARDFVDFLKGGAQSCWQMLPLGPPAKENSPYEGLSAFAGNPLLIDLRLLVEEGFLRPLDLTVETDGAENRIDYPAATAYKAEWLEEVFKHFQTAAGKDAGEISPSLQQEFKAFCSAQAYWLDDFALFMSLRTHFETPWNKWPAGLARRKADTLAIWCRRLRVPIQKHCFFQFLFFRQWAAMRRYARQAGVQLIGDIPLYVSHDSADVWAHQKLFALDCLGLPRLVAGVPPDYFSAAGQVWNNPLFDWPSHRKSGYLWWIQRLRANLERFDLIRLDHFRGFQAGWGIPYGADTAKKGRWIRGPGKRLFEAAGRELGELSLIAEDLGFITPPVKRLRRKLGYGGMDVLQFSLENMSPDSTALTYSPERILYTGTHDNDTSAAWYRSQSEPLRRRVDRIFGEEEPDISWRIIRYAYASAAALVMVPLQDVLSLGTEARMNVPGTHENNWQWRASRGCLIPTLAYRLNDLAQRFDRTGGPG